MSEVFHYQLAIDPLQFENMMREEDVKKYFKEQMAYELAQQLIATNRVSFTYTKIPNDYQIILNAKVIL